MSDDEDAAEMARLRQSSKYSQYQSTFGSRSDARAEKEKFDDSLRERLAAQREREREKEDEPVVLAGDEALPVNFGSKSNSKSPSSSSSSSFSSNSNRISADDDEDAAFKAMFPNVRIFSLSPTTSTLHPPLSFLLLCLFFSCLPLSFDSCVHYLIFNFFIIFTLFVFLSPGTVDAEQIRSQRENR
jgi:hypothetical protein